MVMLILSGLVALAAPFVISMLLHSRSARNDLAAVQAKAGAEAAVDHAIAQLHRTLKAPGYDATPDCDTLDELKVEMVFPGVELNVKDARGVQWSARVEDEQGKLNLQSAPPTLIGNLLCSSTLTESVNPGSNVLLVDDPDLFPSDGEAGTVDGYVCIGNDLVSYTHVRGTQLVLGTGLQYGHRKGELVYDGRAAWIADYKFNPGSDALRPFRSIYEIKAIGEGNPTMAIRPEEFARIERFITVQSGREGPAWGRAERVLEQTFQSIQEWFTVENGSGFEPGAVVRFEQAGRTITYVRTDVTLVLNQAPYQNWTTFHTASPIGVSVTQTGIGMDVYVSPLLYHPINLNTAPPEVVFACVMGVCLSQSNEAVTRQKAWLTANHLTSRTYRTTDELHKALDEAEAKGLLTRAQSEAVFINATEFNSPKLRTSTVPFSFRSGGSFTVEGTGIVNASNGLQLARHTLRQTFTLPSLPPGHFEIKTQADFQQNLDQGLGARVVTWPVPLPPTTGKFKRSYQGKKPDMERGDVRLAVGQSGRHGLPNEFLDHCDDPNQAFFMQEGYDAVRHGAWKLPGIPGQNGYVPVTGVELWYKPTGGGQAFIFDQGAEIDRNRVSVLYQPGMGVLVRVFDANLLGQYIEYKYPAQLDAGKWHHIAASFRSSFPNGQEVRVDGQFQAKDAPVEFSHGTRLSADIDEDDDTLELDDAKDFPPKGALRIGEEIIEYERAGNSFMKLIRGVRLSLATNHRVGEYAMVYGYACPLVEDLPIGGATLTERIEKVAAGEKNIFTQVNFPKPPPGDFVLHTETSKLPVLSAVDFPPSGYILVQGEIIYYGKKSAAAFENLTRAQRIGSAFGKARNLRHTARVVLLSFEISKPTEYHASGYVQIDSEDDDKIVEWIQYAQIKQENGKTYLCASVESNNTGMIQQGPVPPTNLPNENSVVFKGFRGALDTANNLAHAKKAKVIQVVRMQGPQCGTSEPGRTSHYGDGSSTVSVLTRGQAGGDVRWIKRAHEKHELEWRDSNRNRIGDTPVRYVFEYRAALNDFTSRRYPAGSSRFLRFPSGELPDVATSPRMIGASMDGQGEISGVVDEVKLLTLDSLSGQLALDMRTPEGLKASGTDAYVETCDAYPVAGDAGGRFNSNWPKEGGLIRIEDELLYYDRAATSNLDYLVDIRPGLVQKLTPRTESNPEYNTLQVLGPNLWTFNKQVTQLTGLKRGVLGTTAVAHPPGAQVMLFDAAPISVLNTAITAQADGFSVKEPRGFPKEGYAWIDGEVLSWTTQRQGNFAGCRAFRGRFGTNAAQHDAGSIAQAIPFRYWDRAPDPKVPYDGAGIAYFQAGHFATGAVWENVELKLSGGSNPLPNFCRARVLVRFDGRPGWDTTPTNREGGLFQFAGQGKFSLRGLARASVKADQIEIRVYWDYTAGAWAPSEEWKQTFAIEGLSATYSSPFVMQRLEQIEKR